VAEVFEWGPRVMKLYRSAAAKPTVFREAGNHGAVEALGLPVPAIWSVQQIGGRWGIVFERVRGASFAEQMPPALPHYLEILARLQARIHEHQADEFHSLKVRLATRIARAKRLDEPRKQLLLGRLAEMPEGDRLCHGDFHPINVLGDASQPVVIDWPDASRGDPAADVCRSYLLLRLHAQDIAEPYLDAYCRQCAEREGTGLAALRRRGAAGRRRPERPRTLTRNRALLTRCVSPASRPCVGRRAGGRDLPVGKRGGHFEHAGRRRPARSPWPFQAPPLPLPRGRAGRAAASQR